MAGRQFTVVLAHWTTDRRYVVDHRVRDCSESHESHDAGRSRGPVVVPEDVAVVSGADRAYRCDGGEADPPVAGPKNMP